jgi:hypothetical protein
MVWIPGTRKPALPLTVPAVTFSVIRPSTTLPTMLPVCDRATSCDVMTVTLPLPLAAP